MGAGKTGFAFMNKMDAHRPPPIEFDALGVGMGKHFKVAPMRDRMQKRTRCSPPYAATLVDLEIGAAFVVARVEVVDGRDIGLFSSLAESIKNFPRQTLFFHPPRPARTVEFAGTKVMVFHSFEKRQYFRPTPTRVALLGPAVVIGRLTPHVDHAVDGGAAAQDPAARIAETATIQPRVGLGGIAPVCALVADAVKVTDKNMDPAPVVAPPGFQQ